MNFPYHPILSSDLKPLLPNEPRVLNWEIENALTERYLVPSRDDIELLFLHLRQKLDVELRETQPLKRGKLYPLGQCLEISLAMQRLLKVIDPSTLSEPSARGYMALASFMHHGGSMRQVWGDLRGEYFQNAFLAGTLYIDVSNDTVTSTKPPVEILPFAEARFSPVRDYVHFAQLASRYWKAHLIPNHIVPTLAPHFPLIAVVLGSGVHFEAASDYMIAMVEAGEFRASEAVLYAPSMRDDLFQLMAQCFAGASFEVASDPTQGRALALQYCAKYRNARYHHDVARRATLVEHLLEANKRLACLKVQASAPKAA